MTFRAAAAAVLVLLPASSFAEPAVVRLLEAPARSAPSKDAAVVHLFAENAQVSVSEEATAGFRRVRLPDGERAHPWRSSWLRASA